MSEYRKRHREYNKKKIRKKWRNSDDVGQSELLFERKTTTYHRKMFKYLLPCTRRDRTAYK